MTWKFAFVLAFAAGVLGTRAEAVERPIIGKFSLVGKKQLAPQTRMSEAGIRWSLTRRLVLDLSYERTGYAPMMSFDHDNGIMSSFRIGF